MGYNLYIGNATPAFDKEDGYLSARWVVGAEEIPEAPALPNDVNPNCNYRWPSYSGWADFCDTAGIHELFYGHARGERSGERGGILVEHPGCVMLTEEHYKAVADALTAWKARATLPPGFTANPQYDMSNCVPGEFDPILARLVWLEWWMRWALDNCETPAFYNS